MKKVLCLLFVLFHILSCSVVLANDKIYTKEELEAAFLYLREHREEWNLTGYGIADNGLKIEAPEWTTEKKEELKEILGIENIQFTKTQPSVDITDIGRGTGFIMRLGEALVDCPDIDYIVKYACKVENGVFMIPIGTIFTVSGFKTETDKENGTFKAFLVGETLTIDSKTQCISIGGYSKKMLIPPQFLEDECYIAQNDFGNLISYHKDGQIQYILWYAAAEEWFTDSIVEYIQREGKAHIYTAVLGTDTFLKDDVPLELDTTIYEKDGHLMLPIRALFTAIDENAQVSWDKENMVAKVEMKEDTLLFYPLENKIVDDKKEIFLSDSKDTGSMDIKDGRLFLPLRTVQTLLGVSDRDIYWNDLEKTASVRIYYYGL